MLLGYTKCVLIPKLFCNSMFYCVRCHATMHVYFQQCFRMKIGIYNQLFFNELGI